MTKCVNCGREIPPGKFCAYCGAEVSKASNGPLPPSFDPSTLSPRYEESSSGGEPTLVNRMARAMRLDVSLYEEVEKDEKAMNQAVAVVVISSICAGIGSMIGSLSEGGAGLALVGSIVGMITALIGWFIWSFITYFVGTRITKGQETKADYGELLRTIGFSSSPGVINVLSFIPLVSFIAGIWQLAAMIVAVRQALDFTTTRAILTCIIGWIVNMLILVLIGGLMAIPFLL